MKGYWIAHVDVIDAEQYVNYTRNAPAAFALYGGKFLARGGSAKAMEGNAEWQRNVIIEFESYEQAVKCYESPEYQAAAAFREGAATAQIVIVQGV